MADSTNTAPQVDMTPFVDALLATGEGLKSEKDALFGKIKGNRDMLRALVAQGAVTEAQTAKITALYPRGTKSDDTPAADAPKPAPAKPAKS